MVKGRGREIPPLVIVAWTQGVACTAWVLFFLLSGRPFVAPGPLWPAVAASCVLVLGMSGLLARASARGDISIVGPILALSPIFTIVPDAVLSGGLPSALGWIGLAFSLTGTVSLSGQGTGRLGRIRVLFARRDALDALGAAFLLGFLAAGDGTVCTPSTSTTLLSLAETAICAFAAAAKSGRASAIAVPRSSVRIM